MRVEVKVTSGKDSQITNLNGREELIKFLLEFDEDGRYLTKEERYIDDCIYKYIGYLEKIINTADCDEATVNEFRNMKSYDEFTKDFETYKYDAVEAWPELYIICEGHDVNIMLNEEENFKIEYRWIRKHK